MGTLLCASFRRGGPDSSIIKDCLDKVPRSQFSEGRRGIFTAWCKRLSEFFTKLMSTMTLPVIFKESISKALQRSNIKIFCERCDNIFPIFNSMQVFAAANLSSSVISNFRYFRRQENHFLPSHEIQFNFKLCSADFLDRQNEF